MKSNELNIAFFSTFPPTQCGIATYTTDLIQSVSRVAPSLSVHRFTLTRSSGALSDSHTIHQNSPDDFLRAAQLINLSAIDAVDIQHEFKIYGDPDGCNLQILLDEIKKPIVSTLHSVYPNLSRGRDDIFRRLVKRSDRLFVFSSEAKDLVCNNYQKAEAAVNVIPHGIPTISFKALIPPKESRTVNRPLVFVSAGHMRPKKGYEVAIEALSFLRNEIPSFRYIILGANHPQDLEAKSYRNQLLNLISNSNLTNNVEFIDEYLNGSDLIEYLQTADVCLVPYTVAEQSSSGILSLMIGCGRPVVSTPFQFAKSYVNDFSGILSDSFSASGFAQAVSKMIAQKGDWIRIAKYNHELAREWQWNLVSGKYRSVYAEIKKEPIR